MKQTKPEFIPAQPPGASPQTDPPPNTLHVPKLAGVWVLEPLPGLEFVFGVWTGGDCVLVDYQALWDRSALKKHDAPAPRPPADPLREQGSHSNGLLSCLRRCRVPQQVVRDVTRTQAILQAAPTARLPEDLEQRVDRALTKVFWAEINPHLDPPLPRRTTIP